jgi:uncharacterized protein (DUF305 family)
MTRIFLIGITSALAMTAAVAQQPTPHSGMKPDDMDMKMMQSMASDSAATKGYKASMMSMMRGMPAYTGDADVDFMKQMKGHHQAAIDMAKVELEHGKDAQAKTLAQEIVAAQEKEIATIDTWLKAKGK